MAKSLADLSAAFFASFTTWPNRNRPKRDGFGVEGRKAAGAAAPSCDNDEKLGTGEAERAVELRGLGISNSLILAERTCSRNWFHRAREGEIGGEADVVDALEGSSPPLEKSSRVGFFRLVSV